MNDKDKKNLEFLIYHCSRLERHVDYFGDDESEYMSNEHYQAACGLEIIEIGEYINRLSDEFKSKHNQINWSGFVGMRIIHAHHYEGIMYDLVWEAITKDIPQLKEYLEKLL